MIIQSLNSSSSDNMHRGRAHCKILQKYFISGAVHILATLLHHYTQNDNTD